MSGRSEPGADVEQLMARAGALLELDRPGEALAMLAPALAADPGDVRLLCLVGLCHLGNGQTAVAVARMREAVALAPGSAEPHRLLSLALGVAGDDEGACRAAEDAVRADPWSVDARARLAECLSPLPGRHAEGLDNARWVVTQNPDDPDAHLALAMALVAAPGRPSRDAANEARRALDRAAALAPAAAQVPRARAHVAIRTRAATAAVRAATDAVFLEPGDLQNRDIAHHLLQGLVLVPYLLLLPALVLRSWAVYVPAAATLVGAVVYLVAVRRHRWALLADFARQHPHFMFAEAMLWVATLLVTLGALLQWPYGLGGIAALLPLLLGCIALLRPGAQLALSPDGDRPEERAGS